MTLAATLQEAAQRLNQNQPSEALDLLLPLSREFDDVADIWQLLALAYKGIGQFSAAESAFLKAIALSPVPHVIVNLANLYRQAGDLAQALSRYDEALKIVPDNVAASVNRARTLMDLGRFEEAEIAFRAVTQSAPHHVNGRIGLAQVLQKMGYQEQAIEIFQDVLNDNPENAAALNGLGISLKVLGYADDAVEVLQQGARHAPDSPEIYSNLASALVQSDRPDEAVACYQQALSLDPENPDLHDWYNGYLGVLEHPEYLESYRKALQARPEQTALAEAYARKLFLNGRVSEAEQVLLDTIGVAGENGPLARELSHVRRESGQFDAALEVARRAVALDPDEPANKRELASAIMAAAQDYDEALDLLRALVSAYPYDQGLWALYATALRYTQREQEYRELVDYDKLVNKRYLTPPEGFESRGAFVAHIREALLSLHTTRRHPVEQSMVNGTQTLDDLFSRRDPAVGLVVQSLHQQLQELIDNLPSAVGHPLLRRNTGKLGFSDSWSVLLREHGYHKNHFHSEGWLSSALYLIVPDAVSAGGGEGWIKFGEPGFRAREPLAAEYWIKPEEGALVVFPSYLWHGTEPLKTASQRMS
ncbi:MAG: hypothetical protein RLZZ602_792, partial [Pseudomonadota bacterium]